MTGATGTTLPVVAVLCRVPIVAEALAGAFEGMAEVRIFPSNGGNTAGVLRWLRPDAVVVDDEHAAASAAPYAVTEGGLLVHVSVQDGAVRVFTGEGWEIADVDGSSPDAIRNLVIGSLLRRVGV
jgi:hypothetical protein